MYRQYHRHAATRQPAHTRCHPTLSPTTQTHTQLAPSTSKNSAQHYVNAALKRGKFCHTRYLASGLELILVYRQSARRWLSHPSPGGRLRLLSIRHAVNSATFTRWRQLYTVAHIRLHLTTHLSTLKGWKAELPGWLICSGWFTNNGGHPSAASRAWDRESSPARHQHSTTGQRNQLPMPRRHCFTVCGGTLGTSLSYSITTVSLLGSQFHLISVSSMVVKHSPLPAHRSETHCLKVYVTLLLTTSSSIQFRWDDMKWDWSRGHSFLCWLSLSITVVKITHALQQVHLQL